MEIPKISLKIENQKQYFKYFKMEELNPPSLLNNEFLIDEGYLDLENKDHVIRWRIKGRYKQLVEEEFQFTLAGISKKFAEQKIDCRLQEPNYNSFIPAQKNIKFRKQTIRDYFQYLDNPQQFLKNNELDEGSVLFAVNIDMENWKGLTSRFYELLPKNILPKSKYDGLSYLRQQILGMNVPQCYIKTSGVWTGGHQENLAVQAINYNHGPGDCIWYTVDTKYVPQVRKLVEEQFQVDILKNEGLWFKQHEWFQENDIPIQKFIQKEGEFVYLEAGCLHWVSSRGKTLNTAWNFLHLSQNTFVEMSKRNLINTQILQNMVVPYFNLIFDIYIHGQTLSENVKQFLWDQLKQRIEEEKAQLSLKKFQIQYASNSREVLMCSACKQEIFIYFYQNIQVQTFMCLKCLPHKVFKLKAKYKEEIITKILEKQVLQCCVDMCSIYTGNTTCKVQQELQALCTVQDTLRSDHPKQKLMKVIDNQEKQIEIEKKQTRNSNGIINDLKEMLNQPVDRNITTRHYTISTSLEQEEVPKIEVPQIDIKKKAGRPKRKDNDSDYENKPKPKQVFKKIDHRKIKKTEPIKIKNNHDAKIANNLKQMKAKNQQQIVPKQEHQSSKYVSETSQQESSFSKDNLNQQNQIVDQMKKYIKKKLNEQKTYFKYQIQILRQKQKQSNQIQLQSTRIQEEQQKQIEEKQNWIDEQQRQLEEQQKQIEDIKLRIQNHQNHEQNSTQVESSQNQFNTDQGDEHQVVEINSHQVQQDEKNHIQNDNQKHQGDIQELIELSEQSVQKEFHQLNDQYKQNVLEQKDQQEQQQQLEQNESTENNEQKEQKELILLLDQGQNNEIKITINQSCSHDSKQLNGDEDGLAKENGIIDLTLIKDPNQQQDDNQEIEIIQIEGVIQEDDFYSLNQMEDQRKEIDQLNEEEARQEYQKIIEAAQLQKEIFSRKQSLQDQASGSQQNDQKSILQEDFSFGVSIIKTDDHLIDEPTPQFDPKYDQTNSNSQIDDQINILYINIENKDEIQFDLSQDNCFKTPSKDLLDSVQEKIQSIPEIKVNQINKAKGKKKKKGKKSSLSHRKVKKFETKMTPSKNGEANDEIQSIFKDEIEEISSIIIEEKEDTRDGAYTNGTQSQHKQNGSNIQQRSWKQLERQQSRIHQKFNKVGRPQNQNQQRQQDREIEETDKIEKRINQQQLVRLKQIDD
ncbi:hypothetical protein pb186bvf_007834 [Paramecium bursaria]